MCIFIIYKVLIKINDIPRYCSDILLYNFRLNLVASCAFKDNICIVRINSADKILYSTPDGLVVARDGQPGLDKFTADAVETIKQLNPNGIFSFRCDRGTSYGMYLEYQRALVSAYNIVREEYSMETYNKPMDALSEEERAAVLKAVPLAIYEAELTNRPQGN